MHVNKEVGQWRAEDTRQEIGMGKTPKNRPQHQEGRGREKEMIETAAGKPRDELYRYCVGCHHSSALH